eukprot:366000-Chlamydomonas_euryale.AAC.27
MACSCQAAREVLHGCMPWSTTALDVVQHACMCACTPSRMAACIAPWLSVCPHAQGDHIIGLGHPPANRPRVPS